MKIKLPVVFILSLLSLSLTAQRLNTILADIYNSSDTAYMNLWTAADSLLRIEYTREAAAKVKEIETLARRDKNYPQVIKTVLVSLTIEKKLEETNLWQQLQRLDAEIARTPMPHKAVLQSMAGSAWLEVLYGKDYYYEGEMEPDSTNPYTWPKNEVLNRAEGYLLASVENSTVLLDVPVANYATLVEMPGNTARFRPTLYDVLLWRLFDFYKNNTHQVVGNDTVHPASALLFGDANTFTNTVWMPGHRQAYRIKALQTLQTLLRRYMNAGLTDALVMADINRIDFAVEMYDTPAEDSLKRVWLEAQVHKYIHLPIAAELLYRAAVVVSCAAYNPYDEPAGWTGYRCSNTKALQYCQTAIDRFEEEPATEGCRALKERILRKALQVEVENTNETDKPFKIHISYKNTPHLYVKYIAISEDSLGAIKNRAYNNPDLAAAYTLNALMAYTTVEEDNVALPVDTNYMYHSTEWYCKGLPRGRYVLLYSASKDFVADSNITGYAPFWSTGYTVYSTGTGENRHRFFVAGMHDNKPLKGAEVVVSQAEYNYTVNKTEKKIIARGTTGKDGSFEAETDQNYWSVTADVYVKGQLVVSATNNIYLRHTDDPAEETLPTTHFYTDRAIYRPGQTVYYKGYMLRGGKDSLRALANYATTVTLYDANYEEITKANVATNAFGTFSGSFVIPYGRLTGYYTIADAYGSTGIQVEEYKRPKFEVTFDTLKSSPAFYDTVVITGRAIAYAGNVLDGATVAYTVTRTTDYLYYDWSKGYFDETPYPLVQNKAPLDSAGRFTIKFAALPGEDKDLNYTYDITAEITDITGETQMGTIAIKAGNRTVYSTISAPQVVFTDEPAPIKLSAVNLNNHPVALRGQLYVYRLSEEKQIQKELFWSQPDTQIIPQKIKAKYFAHHTYAYARAIPLREKVVYAKEINAPGGADTVLWDAAKIPQGNYEAVYEYTDNTGQTHTVKTTFTVANPKGKKAFVKQAIELVARQKEVQPGNTAEIVLSSRAPKTQVLYYIERSGQPAQLHNKKMNNSLLRIQLPITETDRGIVKITAFTVYDNRFYQSSVYINVPYAESKLDVKITSYRDKMVPGDKEEWQLKITGPNAQKVSAEILASMYDASLDKFTTPYWPDFTNYRPYPVFFITTAQHSISRSYPTPLSGYPYTDYDYSETQEQNSLRFFKWIDDPLSPYDYDEWSDRRRKSGSGFGSGYGSGGGGGGGGNINRLTMRANKSITAQNNAEYGFAVATDMAAPAPNDETAGNAPTGFGTVAGLSQAQLIKIRRNLDETAFFYPHLQTDDNGSVLIKFVAPEALTRWNFRAFAHTKDLMAGYISLSSITQKPLMVQPNLPRFLRQGDEIYITTKVVNLSEKELSPNVVLEVYDATTGKNIPEFNNINAVQVPQMAAGTSQPVKWKFTAPAGYGALKIVIKAYDGQFTDAEANTLPVLSDEMLVTEALPLPFSGGAPKTYELKKLTQSGQSATLRHHKLTVEFTSNPAWYAVQALPYIMEYPYECAEQVFNRYYANSLAYHIANSSPAMYNVFESWKAAASQGRQESLLSNLEKNPELKNILLEETPWLAEGQDESERKQRMGRLFDDNTMQHAIGAALNKLFTLKDDNGAYPWFAGMPANRQITQYIVAGMGRLRHLTDGTWDQDAWEESIQPEIATSLQYMHREAQRRYKSIKASKAGQQRNHLGVDEVQYLYAISYFGDEDEDNRYDYDSSLVFWQTQAAAYWPGRSRMEQAMIALALHRLGDEKTPAVIVEALRQNALVNADNGMYWKEMKGGYGWTDAPIETQAVIIEAFSEIKKDTASVNLMRKWLLKQKQVSDWRTTRATADACYALLLGGPSWLEAETNLAISVGDKAIDTQADPEITTEAGTGYFKQSFTGSQIQPQMGKVTIAPQNGANVPMAWGGLYWQYFEKLDKITRAQTPLALIKQLYLETPTDSGTVKTLLKPGQTLKAGDKITVRILLKVNNDMDYVHLKDMRAAALEPVDYISGYRWQNGVGYYQSIRDAAMNFFFDRLPKGEWMFEYSLRVSQAGSFQNGIATVQSMYAPEYTAHSEGTVIVVEP